MRWWGPKRKRGGLEGGDYQLLRSTKERNIKLAPLANKQSLENLELNSRILPLVKEKEVRMETNVGADLKRATASLKISMETTTKDCVTRLEAQYGQLLQQLTPYDTEDVKRVFDKQVQLLDTLEATNAAVQLFTLKDVPRSTVLHLDYTGPAGSLYFRHTLLTS